MQYGSCLFSVAMILFQIISKFAKSETVKFKVCWLSGIIGIIGMASRMKNPYYILDAMIMQPILWGEHCKKTQVNVKHWVKFLWIVLAIAICTINQISGMEIEISKFELYGNYGFYPMTLLGVLFCLSFGLWIKENNSLARVFSCMGRYSFEIMSGHFMAFKFFDGLLAHMLDVNEDVLCQFPTSFTCIGCGILYACFGIGAPIVCSFSISQVYKRIKNMSLPR